MKSAITVSLVPEAAGGPFVFWDDLERAMASASELGFDAIEIFASGPDAVPVDHVLKMCERYHLRVAAVGTGAGMVKHGLSLTDADPVRRSQAVGFVESMIQFGAQLNAPAIIGSMQGRWSGALPKLAAMDLLENSLATLAGCAASHSQVLLFEPLNRYESNLVNTLAEGTRLIQSTNAKNLLLLADLFHMNIEETDIAQAIAQAAGLVGHVHFVDSNRRAAGYGHLDFKSVIAALHEIAFCGYLSAEALPLPDSRSAAEMTMGSLKQLGIC